MNDNMIRVGLFSPGDASDLFHFGKIPNDIHCFMKLIGCDLFDIVYRTISGVPFCIVCDDLGRVQGKEISAILNNGQPDIFGNMIICHINDYGDMTSISEEDAKLIVKNITRAKIKRSGSESQVNVLRFDVLDDVGSDPTDDILSFFAI